MVYFSTDIAKQRAASNCLADNRQCMFLNYETRENQSLAQKRRSFSHSSRFWSLFPLAETLSLCLNRS
jgi:hypothetical protein